MNRGIQTFVLVVTLALCLVKAAASPIEGTWEGKRGDVKAATITVLSQDGLLAGSAVFYIVHDNADGSHNGEALPSYRMTSVQWDGKVLRFVIKPDDGVSIPFTMLVTAPGKA